MTDISISEITFHSKKTALGDQVLLSLSAISTLCVLGCIFWYCGYGIDLTDESSYLEWISNPFNYSISATQYGFIYHPLYKLVDGNIAVLRQVNFLITYCLGWIVGSFSLKAIFGNKELRKTHRLVISGAIATVVVTSLVFAGLWLPTPSYNSLSLQALLITAIGLLMADTRVRSASLLGWFLIGFGGWLAFMAKPTTAAALALFSIFYLLFSGKFSFRLFAVSVFTTLGLLVLSAFSIDGSIFAFFNRLKGGLELVGILGGGHSTAQLFRLDDFFLGDKGKTILTVCMLAILSASYFSQEKAVIRRYIGATFSLIFVVATLVLVFGFIQTPLNVAGQFRALLIWCVPFAALLLGIISIYRFDALVQISRDQWALGLTFLLLPYAYAFGTNNNYWVLAGNAAIFWIYAGFILLSSAASNVKLPALLLPIGLAAQLMAVALFQTGIDTPYRQPQSLRTNDYKLELGKSGSALKTSKSFGQYFTEANEVATQAGFKKGMPMLDLTGLSPGILYALGASAIGQAWMIGGYPGSDKLAIQMLKVVPCNELGSAWLLTEPSGPEKLSPEVLLSFGADLTTDYQIVGAIHTAEGASGYKKVRVQEFLKPIRPAVTAIHACEATRGAMQ